MGGHYKNNEYFHDIAYHFNYNTCLMCYCVPLQYISRSDRDQYITVITLNIVSIKWVQRPDKMLPSDEYGKVQLLKTPKSPLLTPIKGTVVRSKDSENTLPLP